MAAEVPLEEQGDSVLHQSFLPRVSVMGREVSKTSGCENWQRLWLNERWLKAQVFLLKGECIDLLLEELTHSELHY